VTENETLLNILDCLERIEKLLRRREGGYHTPSPVRAPICGPRNRGVIPGNSPRAIPLVQLHGDTIDANAPTGSAGKETKTK
jgi:hypothetical protein